MSDAIYIRDLRAAGKAWFECRCDNDYGRCDHFIAAMDALYDFCYGAIEEGDDSPCECYDLVFGGCPGNEEGRK